MTPERFKRPTDEEVVKAALMFNNGEIDLDKLTDMVGLCDFIIDRLYEHGDISKPSSKEVLEEEK